MVLCLMQELLLVEDSFVIVGRGVVLIPDFSVPEGGWESRREQVQLETADGSRREVAAQINLTHFSLADPQATCDQKYRVVVVLLNTLDKIPKGTRVYASEDLCKVLL